MSTWKANFKGERKPLPHYWEHTVGSGRALLALRADWQQQLRQCHDDLGFQYVRFHALLSDDMGTLIGQNDKLLYSFHNIDQIFDYLLSIGMKPFVELSFMPSIISSGDTIVFHYKANVTPPRQMSDWITLIDKLVRHLVERYGADEVSNWFFEVWNEPNLAAFWTGTQPQYFELYAATARTVKNIHSGIKVGGPATAMNAWIPEFIAYCTGNGAPIDFISTHHYPTDAFGKESDDTRIQLQHSPPHVLRTDAEKARMEAKPYDVYYTEWSSSSNPRDPLHDEPYCAAFIIKTLMEGAGLTKAHSYWTFSDIFEENYFPSIPFHGGFGLMNIHGIPKPSYRAYEILRSLGTEMVFVDGSHETLQCWGIAGESSSTFLAINFALPNHAIENETVEFELAGMPQTAYATIRRIDSDHSNPKAEWQRMGSPEYPSPQQIKQLVEASYLLPREQHFTFQERVLSGTVDIPPQGAAAITFYHRH